MASTPSFVLLVAAALGTGCGGAVAPVGGNGQDGGGAESGTVEAGGQDAPASTDGPSVQDSPSIVADAPPGSCQDDGVPCFAAAQCCSNACTGGVCGTGSTPSCLGDGAACSSASECCSGSCSGTCGSTPPPSCPVGTNATACEICVAGACCSDIVACENDAVCVQSEQCFLSCDSTPGAGVKCAESCLQTYPSSAAQSLFECAAASCQTTCG